VRFGSTNKGKNCLVRDEERVQDDALHAQRRAQLQEVIVDETTIGAKSVNWPRVIGVDMG
jgi:hypothetical protein